MALTGKGFLAILLGFLFPAADHVVVQTEVSFYLGDAQATLGD